ncbi:cellulase N-terminal Ig-like domain-containing protein [uncultured Algibacter sp.]|uniref:cellulase N-terminal Ig-like domain-containing protein n=1 Tax=uncultured Algibacter sp. TaxID=298659 RepID=UPI002618675F|nr:cellulase N-terminal Ig-like domain-containing protein [uncultured Algibacter sp.]
MKIITFFLISIISVISQNAQTYVNYAEGKSIKTTTKKKNLQKLNDGNLSTGSVRINPKRKVYTVSMDLTAEFKIGGVHLYMDAKGILPIRDFALQYTLGKEWVDIPEAVIIDNFSSRKAIVFNQPISMSAIRIVTSNPVTFGLVEWQVWGENVPAIPYQVEEKVPEPFVAKKHWICVNQVGYNLGASKGFTVPTAKTDLPFSIIEKSSEKEVYKGKLKDRKGYFSDFNPKDSKGKEYVIQLEGDGLGKATSYPFEIGEHLLQKMAYQPSVDFFNDARSIMGTHPSAYGGTAWRDGTYYTHEVPSMVMLYLSNPKVFDKMPVTMSWEKEKTKITSKDFKHIKDYKDDDPMFEAKGYYTDLPRLKCNNTPDLIQSIRFGVGWNLMNPYSADPSGDPLGKQLHPQTIEQFAYFLYGYPAYKKYIGKEFYNQVLDSTVKWWGKSGLFKVITKIGNPKGRHAPGHSIMPNLLMYEVAKRENLANAETYLKAAQDQTQWMLDNVDWNNPKFTKGQRMSEHKTIQGLAHFQYYYPELAPKGLQQKLVDWAEKAVSLSHNMWDFRKFDEENYTLPGYNEAGNIIAFPACGLSVALTLEDGELKDRLVELAYAHYDNFMGRNPQNASSINHPDLGFEGVDVAWPFPDKRKDICARLEITRGSLSSLPGSEMYPFNPKGSPRHGEGWTAYNAGWNLTIAYLNLFEGVKSSKLLKQ